MDFAQLHDELVFCPKCGKMLDWVAGKLKMQCDDHGVFVVYVNETRPIIRWHTSS